MLVILLVLFVILFILFVDSLSKQQSTQLPAIKGVISHEKFELCKYFQEGNKICKIKKSKFFFACFSRGHDHYCKYLFPEIRCKSIVIYIKL
jgi:hypothetical protein